jgi:hypothetical protein
MAERIRTDRGEIDIDDASVIEIIRSGDELRIVVDRGSVHEAGNVEATGRLSLILRGITRERAVKYIGAGIEQPHSDPSHPLDVIEVVDYSRGHLTLQGYLRNEPWYSWELSAQGLAVSWAGTTAHAV